MLKEGERWTLLIWLVHARVANNYSYDGSSIVFAAAQSKSSYLKIFKVQN
jgi:hypothetical protein